MRLLAPMLALAAAALGASCARSSQLPPAADAPTVLKVENRGFRDMNVFVIPETSTDIRLGTVTGNSNGYFTLPKYLISGIRQMRFQARPIATQRGPVSESILVTPGDTVVLIIPP